MSTATETHQHQAIVQVTDQVVFTIVDDTRWNAFMMALERFEETLGSMVKITVEKSQVVIDVIGSLLELHQFTVLLKDMNEGPLREFVTWVKTPAWQERLRCEQ